MDISLFETSLMRSLTTSPPLCSTPKVNPTMQIYKTSRDIRCLLFPLPLSLQQDSTTVQYCQVQNNWHISSPRGRLSSYTPIHGSQSQRKVVTACHKRRLCIFLHGCNHVLWPHLYQYTLTVMACPVSVLT